MYSQRNRQSSRGSLVRVSRARLPLKCRLPSPLIPQNYLLLRYLLREDHIQIKENPDHRRRLPNLIRTLAHHHRSHYILSSLLPALSAARGYHQDMNQLRLSRRRHKLLGHQISLMLNLSLSTRILRGQALNLLSRKGYRSPSHQDQMLDIQVNSNPKDKHRAKDNGSRPISSSKHGIGHLRSSSNGSSSNFNNNPSLLSNQSHRHLPQIFLTMHSTWRYHLMPSKHRLFRRTPKKMLFLGSWPRRWPLSDNVVDSRMNLAWLDWVPSRTPCCLQCPPFKRKWGN